MIPTSTGFLSGGFEMVTPSSCTYALRLNTGQISGVVDEVEAVTQFVYKTLKTERYTHIIYPKGFGVELDDLIGTPTTYASAEIKRRIEDALLRDSRITAVDSFKFEANRNILSVTFAVHSIFGDFTAEKEVTT